MNDWILTISIAALIGSALISGVFFAFSSFVMKALGRVPSSEGMRAMQSINIVVINPWFLGAFIGTAVLSAALIGITIMVSNEVLPHWFLVGSLFYLFGTFAVTVFGNVPLNNELASASPENGDALWKRYLNKWTFLNHVRTAAAVVATFTFTMGLLQS